MAWRIKPLNGELGGFKSNWDDLSAHAGNPYFDSDFIDPLLTHFGSGKELICEHRDGSEPDTMAIIRKDRFGIWSLFAPAQAQIAPLITRNAKSLGSLLSHLHPLALGLNLYCLDPEYTPFVEEDGPLPIKSFKHAHTMAVRPGNFSSFEAYWACRSSNLKKSMKRRTRRVSDAGIAMSFACLEQPDEVAAGVERFAELEQVGWKGRSGTAVSMDNDQGRFYLEVLTRFARKGRASVYELRFDDRVVATQLAIASESMLVLLKTSYDETLANFGVGRLLLRHVLEQEFLRSRVNTIEFYTNADSDQLAWATHDRWTVDCMLLRNRCVHAALSIRDRLKKPPAAVADSATPESLQETDG